MSYYVYENWRAAGHRARIHFSSCSFCRNGKGIHPGSSSRNGRWLGPFDTFEAASSAAYQTGGDVRVCEYCRPR